MGWFMSADLFVAITYGLLLLCITTIGLLFGVLLLRRELFPRRMPSDSGASVRSADISDLSPTSERPLHCPTRSSLSVEIVQPP